MGDWDIPVGCNLGEIWAYKFATIPFPSQSVLRSMNINGIFIAGY
jgi:hypothetical protein